jgi:hypothetical protein
MATYPIASNGKQVLVCDTGDLDYVPDPVRYHYGRSNRPALEDLFLALLDFTKSRYPKHEIFTLGTSLVFGEKFVTYLTICELEIRPGSFKELQKAVRSSDQAIRRKLGSMWEWGLCLIGDNQAAQNQAALVIGWLDFAYFVQHRKDFLNTHHNHFMAAFASGKSQSADYKVLHDGTIVEFDPQQLRKDERQVFDHASEIRFEVVHLERPEERLPLTMV